MRSMVLDHPAKAEDRPLAARETKEPTPGEGEVAIDVEACGVCHTDLHIVEGEVAARLPIVPGHQAAGRVARGRGRGEGFLAGDRVGVGWIASTCGICPFCRTGRENLCEEATFTGRDRDGGFAEK